MNKNVRTINNIRVNIPYQRIFNRLGFRKHFTEITEEEEAKIRKTIDEAFLLTDLKGLYFISENVRIEDDKKYIINDTFEFISSQFCDMMKNTVGISIFAVTAGIEITEERDRLMSSGEMTKSIIYDAVGSELAEEAAEFMHDFIRKLKEPKGLTTTKRRYSPGYGDLPIENQGIVDQILDVSRIGITITDSFLMIPEKSVTAMVGLI